MPQWFDQQDRLRRRHILLGLACRPNLDKPDVVAWFDFCDVPLSHGFSVGLVVDQTMLIQPVSLIFAQIIQS